MLGDDCKLGLWGCQVGLVLAVSLGVAQADAAEARTAEIRRAVKSLKRLERTCIEYAGRNPHKLLDAMVLEAVRLYEGAKYAPALDSILLGAAMYPKGAPRTYYGLQPGMVEIALRMPTDDEAALLPLDPKKYSWVMVAVANLSGVKLELGAMRAAVERDGFPVKDAAGRPVRSLAPEDGALKELLGARVLLLAPPPVNQGETATFPVVFPAFESWTEIRFVDDVNKIQASVKDYAAAWKNRGRYLRACRLVAKRRGGAPSVAKPGPGGRPKPRPAPEVEYVLVGSIKNEISAGQYGATLVEPLMAKRHRRFYVRRRNVNLAELRPVGETIMQLVTAGYKPKAGDKIYVRRAPKQAAARGLK